ncbi:DUF5996 family protein [Glacieibacterium megasporae]|uniref:DUF5996 family protein n=1 Tax=Glacieibacterium megasporae TaxID=2835787 RepID=UPI001C1E3D89|nr:DUF5996 family protein [Polymorphobacter megasporae]UAJ11117.1 DUF5996 family protein [Polymorphobacter megasporae]
MTDKTTPWPTLDWPAWRETALHLQLMTQVAGKVRLTLSPWLNHSWHVALYVTPRGLTTSSIPAGARSFQIDFDLLAATLLVSCSDGGERVIALEAGLIAAFYAAVMVALADLGIEVTIDQAPSEMPDAVRFSDDHAVRPYDAAAARNFHRALVRIDTVFKAFRTCFLGKASPVHFFWGSFDLAVTRFSGRRAPLHPGGPGLPLDVAREAYSHEESSAGFWPGSDAYPHPAFYSYAYPAPDGFAGATVAPAAAQFDGGLGEFILRYDDVSAAADPDAAIMEFLQSTYAAAADLGGWDRDALECGVGVPGIPRAVT